MAPFPAVDVFVRLNSQNVSSLCVGVDLPDQKTQIETSGFNSTGTKEFIPGQREQTIVLTLLQDFAPGQLHNLLNPLYLNNTIFPIEIRPTSSAIWWYGGPAQMYEYDGLPAQVNNQVVVTVTLTPAPNTIWAWAT